MNQTTRILFILLSVTMVTVFSAAAKRPGPNIAGLNPTSGTTATAVTIAGTKFGATQGTSTVTFNGTVAAPTSWSGTSIVAPVPSGATTGPVVVTVNGVASNSVSFTVDTTPTPTFSVSNVESSGITSSTATITWTTDQPANGQVEYGATTSYGLLTLLVSTLTTTHSASLTGLSQTRRITTASDLEMAPAVS